MFRSFVYAISLVFFCFFAGAVPINAQDQFKEPCPTPQYPAPLTTSLPIDAQCVVQGGGPEVNSNPAEGEQNKAKNNFCAQDTGGPVRTADMKNLQDKVMQDPSINFGEKVGPTKDRSKLQSLGEGKIVVFMGYVLKARQEGAESVNCELGKPAKGAKAAAKTSPATDALHDIHISLVDSKSVANECQSIVAEMSPHHRPAEWNQKNVDKVRMQGLQVRVTGQLFFDSSHNLPCVGGKPPSSSTGSPVRIALWEIHPIYKFEVCPSGSCATTGWKSLSDFVDGK